MRVNIKNRWVGETIYTAEIPDDTESGMQARIALEQAVAGDANLRGADLGGANLGGANLGGANLGGAYLGDLRSIWGTTGNLREIKALQLETWPAAYTATHMQIGCQLHPLADWWSFDDERISSMSSDALEWWRKWGPVLRQIIEMSPAVPGGEKPEPEA